MRLHTNYPHHRAAALRVLGVAAERPAVAEAVARWQADELERAVVESGGCAAAMRTLDEWRAHPQGRAVALEPAIALEWRAGKPQERSPRDLPLDGVRVLDLTRVLAGPTCTTFLGSLGADVLRIDPPGFDEMAAILCETSAAKRRARLDLGAPDGVERFEQLARGADVLVVGYRAGAIDRRGLGEDRLRALNPSLVVARLAAYGFGGPWSSRRGFDSLVQMSSGIAARGAQAAGADRPVPLPAQALDYATGYLLAAGVCRALAERLSGAIATVRASLARTAALLVSLGEGGDTLRPLPSPADLEPWIETVPTWWGPLRRIRHPGAIDGLAPSAGVAPGPVGLHEATWADQA